MSDFYSDIKMGDWGFPIHIGCYNFSWTLYCDAYNYSQHTQYGCEILKDKMWLVEKGKNYAVFDFFNIYDKKCINMNTPLHFAVGKANCMDLYKEIMSDQTYLIVGSLNSNTFYNVYQENSKNSVNSKLRMMSFSDYDTATQYRDFLIRIPYNKYQTEDNMRIDKINLSTLI